MILNYNFFLKNRYIRRGVLLLPFVVFFILFILIMNQKPYVIFPDNEDIIFGVYSDKPFGGKSEINVFEVDEWGMFFSYTLKKGIEFPFAGINFFKQKVPSHIDLSRYSHAVVHITSTMDSSLTFYINTFLDNYSTHSSHLSYVFYQHTFYVTPDTKVYKVRLRDLTIPEWWLQDNSKVDSKMLSGEDFSQVQKLTFTNGSLNALEVPQYIQINKIQFEPDKKKGLLILALPVIIYSVLLSLIIYFFREKVKNEPVYASLDLLDKKTNQSKESEKLKRITGYIANQYHIMDLTVEAVSQEVHIAAYRISQLLKDTYGLSYPAYINTIRIEESKRLLKETDLKIIDIAMTIGYKNVSHFHRIFKKYTGISPNQFRQDNKPVV